MLNIIETTFLLHSLKRNLNLSRERSEALQLSNLKKIISHAYFHVPYYKGLFDKVNFKPSEIKSVEDISKIPTTSKGQLQSVPLNNITADNIDLNNCFEDVTSGSTGIPLKVFLTPKDYLIRSLIFIRTFMKAGYRLTDKQAIVTDTRFITEKKYLLQKLGIFRKAYVPVQIDIDKQIDILMEFRPDFIHGYPQSIAAIADRLIKKKITSISPRMVCTGAELVSRKTRLLINQAFGVDMSDTYASIESGLIAWQCEKRKGYHINQDHVVIEILKDGCPAMPGEAGKVVITNLHSYAMPIIRYELGDICVLSDANCSCGCATPLISIVKGRVDDMIYTPSKKTVSPNSITNAMEAVEGVQQFRIIQEQINSLQIEIVKGEMFSDQTQNQCMALMKDLVGEEMEINIHLLDHIKKDSSGKIRAVISKISKQIQKPELSKGA
ncbi:MAG: hypothetical protein ABIJ59_13280 [Pseudomonadota bacterium]